MANVALTRHRRIAQKALRTCATPNKLGQGRSEERQAENGAIVTAGSLILLVCVLILAAAAALDVPRFLAYVVAL